MRPRPRRPRRGRSGLAPRGNDGRRTGRSLALRASAGSSSARSAPQRPLRRASRPMSRPARSSYLALLVLMPDWLFVDGSSLIFRAFYGVPSSIRSPDGKPVNAVRGFMDRLARLVNDRRPGRIAVASDEDWRPRWRVDLIPSYKAHRVAEPVPPALEPQMPIIHEVMEAVGIDFIGVADYEAEDVIASWVAQVPAGSRVDIASGDRDLFALVRGSEVRVLYPEKNGLAEIEEAAGERRHGVPGRSYADYAILRGDPSDGLPGLPGVGARRAAELVQRYGGIAGVLEHVRLRDAD